MLNSHLQQSIDRELLPFNVDELSIIVEQENYRIYEIENTDDTLHLYVSGKSETGLYYSLEYLNEKSRENKEQVVKKTNRVLNKLINITE